MLGDISAMKINEIAFTAYPVTDLSRARQFYEKTLGLSTARAFGDDKQGWVEYDIGQGTLAIANVSPDWKPAGGGGCVGFELDNFETAVKELRAANSKFVVEPMDTPVCHMAVVSDPDGNSVAIHKRKAV